jgi:hypothetical protein
MAHETTRPDQTLLDLVTAVLRHSQSERELIATVVRLVNSGEVRLCGIFKGARFESTSAATDAAHRPAP